MKKKFSGNLHPKLVKEKFAPEITTRFHNEESAKAAKAEFDSVHSGKCFAKRYKRI